MEKFYNKIIINQDIMLEKLSRKKMDTVLKILKNLKIEIEESRKIWLIEIDKIFEEKNLKIFYLPFENLLKLFFEDNFLKFPDPNKYLIGVTHFFQNIEEKSEKIIVKKLYFKNNSKINFEKQLKEMFNRENSELIKNLNKSIRKYQNNTNKKNIGILTNEKNVMMQKNLNSTHIKSSSNPKVSRNITFFNKLLLANSCTQNINDKTNRNSLKNKIFLFLENKKESGKINRHKRIERSKENIEIKKTDEYEKNKKNDFEIKETNDYEIKETNEFEIKETVDLKKNNLEIKESNDYEKNKKNHLEIKETNEFEIKETNNSKKKKKKEFEIKEKDIQIKKTENIESKKSIDIERKSKINKHIHDKVLKMFKVTKTKK